MLVHDDERCVLGRSRGWPVGWFSTLAGFVESGETPEQAVVRETREEAKLEVCEADYFGSQFWAGPYSLMLGFRARCASVADAAPGEELERADTYTRQELSDALRDGRILVPSAGVLAGDMIVEWLSSSD